jgi:phosphate transport system permease protein
MPATPTPSERPRRQSGETRIWLTGMGLLLGLLMVAGLLLLVLTQGLAVFWPAKIETVTIKAETEGAPPVVLIAEVTREQSRKLPGEAAEVEEIQLFLGNRELTGQAFRFVDKRNVISREPASGIMVAERMEYGDLIGYPVAVEPAGAQRVEATAPDFRRVLAERVKVANALRDELEKLEKEEIGKASREMRDLEVEARKAKRELSSIDPVATAMLATRLAEIEAKRQAKEAPIAALMARAQEMRAQLTADQFVYRVADGKELRIPLGNIVNYHFPNEMGTGAKLAHFFSAIHAFLTENPREANTEGGIFPAIFGTFVMTVLMSLLVTPLGVIAAIYLREYAHQGPLVRLVRICVNNLAGVPSIVFGVFGVGFFLYGLGYYIDRGPREALDPTPWLWTAGFGLAFFFITLIFSIRSSTAIRPVHPAATALWVISAALLVYLAATCPYFHGFYPDSAEPVFGTGGILWASLTLALMTLPVVIVASEEALAAVPKGAREAALACGASKWQTIQRVVLPSALPGIMTGVILAMARGAGEVAPLMLTGVVKLSPTLPFDGEFPFIHADRKFMHLGFHIYDLGFQSPDADAARPVLFATTLFLILLVIIMNVAAIRLRNWLRDKYKASTF